MRHSAQRQALVIIAAWSVGSALSDCARESPTVVTEPAIPEGPATLEPDDGAISPFPRLPGTTGTGICIVINASTYDQSCSVDTDCMQVSEVSSCPIASDRCYNCPLAAINTSGMARYHEAFSADFGVGGPPACSCPAIGYPCCRAGMCQARCFAAPADTLGACAEAGGTCTFPARFGCAPDETEAGPADACAYSDEICCRSP
jgi:hypothetical protein